MLPNYRTIESPKRENHEYISTSLNMQEVANLIDILNSTDKGKELLITSSNITGIGQNTYVYYDGKKFDITDYGAW
jgi:hypothetical protein